MNVVVIGGGVIGCAVAHALAVHGARVRVVDMRTPGHGASRASAGMLAPYIEGHGDALLELGAHALSLYDDFVRRVSIDAECSIEYARSGTLQVARSHQHAGYLEQTADQLRRRGVEHHLLSGQQARQLEPALSSSVRTGLLIPVHGHVHVGTLLTALRRAAVNRGVHFSQGHVVGVHTGSATLRLELEGESLEADVVVVAAGSWSGHLTVGTAPVVPVKPIRGQLVELSFPQPPVSRIVWSEDCYLVPWQNGSLLVGATVEDVGFDESSTPEGVASLLAAARETVPSCASAPTHDVRVGLRPATHDELPLVGWSSTVPGVCYATGHYRNGVLLAPFTAALVAELIDGTGRAAAPQLSALVTPARVGL